jgi:hypothetical protein
MEDKVEGNEMMSKTQFAMVMGEIKKGIFLKKAYYSLIGFCAGVSLFSLFNMYMMSKMLDIIVR